MTSHDDDHEHGAGGQDPHFAQGHEPRQGQGVEDARAADAEAGHAQAPTAGAYSHAPHRRLDEALPPINEHDYLSRDVRAEDAFSRRIDLYYNTPLDIFVSEAVTGKKPDRFHVIFKRQIEERFPDEESIRERVTRFGRWVFGILVGYVLGKRAVQAAAIVGFGLMAFMGPTWVSRIVPAADAQLWVTAFLMLLLAGVFFALNAIVFVQYRTTLENRSYVLSREIVQHTRELQNLYTTIRALPDQSETLYPRDGPAWGRRSAFLTRMVMWLAARMEYLEKFIQVSMWRVQRERYWMNWVGRILTVMVVAAGVWGLLALPAPDGDAVGFRGLQGLALALTVLVTWASYFLWKTPLTLISEKLGDEHWIRYADLDLDNTIGDQVRRDKERLVEYRHLTRSR